MDDEDYVAFAEWQQLAAFGAWLEDSFDNVMRVIRDMKTKLPENLHGLFDSDD